MATLNLGRVVGAPGEKPNHQWGEIGGKKAVRFELPNNEWGDYVVLEGDPGKEVEFNKSSTHIQWRYVGSTTWVNLVALSDLKGPQGEKGEMPNHQWGVVGGKNAIRFELPNGSWGEYMPVEGDPGREVEFNKTATHLQWRYTGESTWQNLYALADFIGPQGPQGPTGEGLKIDNSGPLSDRSLYNSEPEGFVFLAKDQDPQELYQRKGSAGNWDGPFFIQGKPGRDGRDAFEFGTTKETVAEGNDQRINNGQLAYELIGDLENEINNLESSLPGSYVTTNTAQTITGPKSWTGAHTFSLPVTVGNATANGHAVTLGQVTLALGNKVDKDGSKVLSDFNFSAAYKTKLDGLESSKFKGAYTNLAQLQAAHPSGSAGDYADVDGGVGVEVKRYIWDVSDSEWVTRESAPELTAAQVKVMYESNLDTNAFTDNDKNKLDGIASQATKNQTDAHLMNRANHTGTQDVSTITGLSTALSNKVDVVAGKGLSTEDYTTADKNKVAGLGTASSKNVGTSVGNVVEVQANGKIDPSLYDAGGVGRQILLVTANLTLSAGDNGKVLVNENGAQFSITVPNNSTVELPIGFSVDIAASVGAFSIFKPAGVVVQGLNNEWSTGGVELGTAANLTKIGTNKWILIGGKGA